MFFLSLLHSYLYTNINWNDVKIIWLNEMCSRFILHDIFAWIFIENPSFCGSSHNNLVWSQHRFNIEQHVLFEYDYMLRQWCSVRVNKLCVCVCVCFSCCFWFFSWNFHFPYALMQKSYLSRCSSLNSEHHQQYYLLLKSLSFGHESWLFSEVDFCSNE